MQLLDDNVLRRLADRARALETDAGWDGFAVPPRFHPPATPRELDAAEARLGFALPPVVRQVYERVANGGFGPGYGLLGIGGGATSDTGRDAVDEYLTFREPDPDDANWHWPERVLPICHWGCAIYSCVDCSKSRAEIVRFDPNPVEDDWATAFAPEQWTFGSWLDAWLRGDELFESAFGPADPA